MLGLTPIVRAKTPVAVGDECSSTISVQCESVWPDHASTSPSALASCTRANIVQVGSTRVSVSEGSVSHQHIWLTVYSMSPIFQVDNVCVLRGQRILPYYRHVFKQSATERFVLLRQKHRTIFRQKWRHQRHCRHLNINFKLTFFNDISRHVISSHFRHIVVEWLQCFTFVHLKCLMMMIDVPTCVLTMTTVTHCSNYYRFCIVSRAIISLSCCY